MLETVDEALWRAFAGAFICLYTPAGQTRPIRVVVSQYDSTPHTQEAKIEPVDVDCFNDLIVNTTFSGNVQPNLTGDKRYSLIIKGEELMRLNVTGERYTGRTHIER